MRRLKIIQAIVVFVVIAGAVFVAMDQTLPPDALPASAPATKFSAERAIEHIKVIAEEPRLVGTPAYAKARDYVMDELAKMGLSPEIQTTASHGPQRIGYIYSSVENVIARIEGAETREAILLVAHLDSTPFSPGATDDASGVAILLETARALQAGPALSNSVILLFSGPEESALQGAAAFATQHRWAEDVKLVISIDAGGVSGPSIVTAMSPNNGWLIREYARADPYATGTSAATANAKPQSDYEPFSEAGIPGYNFDFQWDRVIHTPLDSIETLNPPSIQHQGYHALSLARHFGNLRLEDPKGPNAIYFNLLPGRLMVHYPTTWAIPIMLVVTLVYAGVVALGFRRKGLTVLGIGLGGLVLVISLITALLLVRALWTLISSTLPLYQSLLNEHAYNDRLLGTGFGSITIALTATWYALIQRVRKVSLPDLTMGALALGLAGMIGTSIAIPEMSYLFAWPLLASTLAAGYWLYSMNKDREAFSVAQVAGLLVAAIVSIALVVPMLLLSFMSTEETVESLNTVPFLVGMLGFLVPQLHVITRPWKWWLPIVAGLLAVGTLGAAVLDDFDQTKPQLGTAFYVLGADTGQAFWGGGSPMDTDKGGLDQWTAQFFPAEVERQPIPGFPDTRPYFVTDAPAASLAAPQVELLDEITSGGVRKLHLHLSSPRNAYAMLVLAGEGMEIIPVEVNGVSSAPLFEAEQPPETGRLLFIYENLPGEGVDAILEVGTDSPVELIIWDVSHGLPETPGMTIEPMPDHVIPFPYVWAYRTIVFRSVTFDGGGE